MRPIKLTMEAFGSYGGRTEIDFRKFAENEVFLITGETGAGKTTIFDAICYALFARASCVASSNRSTGAQISKDNDRDKKTLVSQYAKSGTASRVELIFLHKGKEYRVERFLSGSKKDSLVCDEGKWNIEGQEYVTAKIQEILNINVLQFKQIAMIAQGEFKKLISASTAERQNILRMIFMTDGYVRMREILGEKAKQSRIGCEALERSIKGIFSKTQCLSNGSGFDESKTLLRKFIEETEERLLDKKKEAMASEKICDEKNRLYYDICEGNRIFSQLRNAREKKAELEEEKEYIEKTANEISKYDSAMEKVQPVYSILNREKSELKDINEKIFFLDKSIEKLKEESRSLSHEADKINDEKEKEQEYRKKAALIENEIPKYNDRARLSNKINAKRKERESAEKKNAALLDEKRSVEYDLGRYEAETADLEDIPMLAASKKTELEGAQRRAAGMKNICDEKIPDFEGKIENMNMLEKKVKKLIEDSYLKEKELNEYSFRYNAAKVGLIASKLENGKPCPVCGSLHHPNPAPLSEKDEGLSDAELKKLENAAKKTHDEREKCMNELSAAKAAALAAKENLRSIFEEFGIPFDETDFSGAKKKYNEILDDLDEINKQLKDILEKEKILEGDKQKIKLLKDEKASIEKKIQDNEAMLNNIKIESGELEGAYSGLSELEYSSLEEALENKNLLITKADEIRSNVEKHIAKEKEVNDKLSKNQGNSEACTYERVKLSENIALYSEKFRIAAEECGLTGEAEFLEIKGLDISERKAEIDSYKREVNTNEGNIASLTKQLGGRLQRDEAEAKKIYEDARKKSKELFDEVNKLSNLLDNHKEIEKILEKELEEYDSSRERCAVYEKLSGLIAGQLAGKKFINLETYIQRSGFISILNATNRRLARMSEDRFELKAHGRDAAAANTLLDLDVFDAYTGKIRPASTLSGGESFITSLSLALGLSDVVAGERGGVSIDSLFIDEGFGNLDSSMMRKAIDVIRSLRSENKFVGVISHREELIGAIEKQIEVKKNAGGSYVEIQT